MQQKYSRNNLITDNKIIEISEFKVHTLPQTTVGRWKHSYNLTTK